MKTQNAPQGVVVPTIVGITISCAMLTIAYFGFRLWDRRRLRKANANDIKEAILDNSAKATAGTKK